MEILEADLAWVLQKGVVCIVDRIIESGDFALVIHLMKATCVAAGVEKGKQTTLTLSSSSGSDSSKPDVVARSTDAMHATIRDFAETDFASYLRLGELGLADHFQLCSEEKDLVPYDNVEGGV